MILLLLLTVSADTLPMVSLHGHITILPPVEQALKEYYEGECPPEGITIPLHELYEGIERKVKTIHDPELGRVTACVCPPGCSQDDCGFEVTTGAMFTAVFECAGVCETPAVPESPAAPVDLESQEQEGGEIDEPPTCSPPPDCEAETMRISDPAYHAWIMGALK